MRSSEAEIRRRDFIYEYDIEKFSEILTEIHKYHEEEKKGDIEARYKREEILRSPDYKYWSRLFSTGPCYDLYKEELEDPDFKGYHGKHPLEAEENLKISYEEGYLDPDIRVKQGYGENRYGKVICFSYDYADLYYKIELDTGKITYETMCAPLDIYKKRTSELIESSVEFENDDFIYYTDKTYIEKDATD